jgi:hypothetical protein
MEGPFLQIEWPVVDNVPVLPVNSPHLPCEGGDHHVIIPITINIKQQRRGSDGALTKASHPQTRHTKITAEKKEVMFRGTVLDDGDIGQSRITSLLEGQALTQAAASTLKNYHRNQTL